MRSKHHHSIWARATAVGVGLALIGGLTPLLFAAEAKTDKTEAGIPPKQKKLTGAELYAINCNRCHPERYPAEWNSREWHTIMLHMRVRANLPAAQSAEILKYLKSESGNQ